MCKGERALILKIRRKDLVWRTVGDEIVAIDLRSSRYLRVNASGALLWQRLQESASREALVDALMDRYCIPREQAINDLEAFLGSLSEHELLES
jgi:hypothetical protein